MIQRKDEKIKTRLSPDEIEKNKQAARQMMIELIFPKVQEATTAVGGVPKLKAFIDSMFPSGAPANTGTAPAGGEIPSLPGLPEPPA